MPTRHQHAAGIRQKLADWGIIDPARVAAVTPLTQQIAAAKTDEEKQNREESDFLRYCDRFNRHLHSHALRHTRGVWLFEHYNAMPRDVQDLMGVGSLALVDRYTRSFKTKRTLTGQGPHLVVPSKPADAAGTFSPPSDLPIAYHKGSDGSRFQ